MALYILITRTNSFFRYMMCEIHYLRLEKGTLRRFQLEVELSEMLQYYPKSLQVFFFCVTKYYDVVQVYYAVSQIQFSQHILHETLECHRCVTQSKGHPGEFVKT